MSTTLTGNTISSTYNQLLHVDGGIVSAEQIVYSGTGIATAMRIGSLSVSVDNIRFDGNSISTLDTNGNLILAPNGSGSVVMNKVSITGGAISGITPLPVASGGTGASTAEQARINLGIGSAAFADLDFLEIGGGTITNVLFIGEFKGATKFAADKLSTIRSTVDGGGLETQTNGVTLDATSILAGGDSTNIDISITPKGTGKVNITNVDVLSGRIPFSTITNKAYASFYDAGTSDQTGSTTDRTAVEWATAAVAGANITVVDNSKLTFVFAGTYRINVSVQLHNADSADHNVVFWFAKNGTNIANTATKITVPKAGDGGKAVFTTEIFVTLAANDYVQLYWFTDDTDVTLHYVAPIAANAGVTPAIPAVPPAIVVVEMIAFGDMKVINAPLQTLTLTKYTPTVVVV